MSYKFTPRQQELIDAMKEGWTLEGVHLVGSGERRWHIHKKCDTHQHRVRSRNVSANTVRSLRNLKVLQTYPSRDSGKRFFFISSAQIAELNKAKIRASWTVELNCDCPKCKEYVNLLNEPDFWDCRELDIAEHDTERSNNTNVYCPKCGHEFDVCCVY